LEKDGFAGCIRTAVFGCSDAPSWIEKSRLSFWDAINIWASNKDEWWL